MLKKCSRLTTAWTVEPLNEGEEESTVKTDCEWNGRLNFIANINGFKVHMDAAKPFSGGEAPQPKQLMLASVCGCTGMDVISLLKKSKQSPEKFRIEAEADTKSSHPHELQNLRLKYIFTGNCESEKIKESVHLSQTKYCAVSAMVSRGTEISYTVHLNGKEIGAGKANFENE